LILFATPNRPDGSPGHVVALFGVGLIGSAVRLALKREGRLEEQWMPLSWTDHDLQRAQLGSVERRMGEWAESRRARRLSFVWSAGQAGFSATADDTAQELRAFESILRMVGRIRRSHAEAAIDVSLVSSAGGLYEGQRRISPGAVPACCRPYGKLKLAQEELLRECTAATATRVFRPTTVYGRIRPGQRRGLIANLVLNGTRHCVTRMIGRTSALRDFVWADDVGSRISKMLLDGVPAVGHTTEILASGRPASIHEVQRLVERIVGHKVFVCFDPRLPNDADITVSPRSLPPGWRATALQVGVQQVYRDWLAGGRGSPSDSQPPQPHVGLGHAG